MSRLSFVSSLVDNPENCLMVGLYHKHQAIATEINTIRGMHVADNFWKGLFNFFLEKFISLQCQSYRTQW